MNRLSLLMISLLFALPLSPVFAQQAPPPMEDEGPEWCQQHADQCAKMKEHRKEFCEKNPVSCKRMEAMHSEQEQWCKANPDDCKKLQAEKQARREKMKEKIKERCGKNPEKCEMMKQNFRKNLPRLDKDPA